MSIQLNNTAAIKGFSFTMELPTGFTFATDEDDFPLADLSIERTTLRRTDHFTADYLNDEQHLEVNCSSSRNYAFSGNSGEICTIVIDVAEDKPLGTYPLVLRNLILTLTDGTEKQVGDIVTCINLVKFYPGDTNLDTYVDADDITYLAKVVVGLEEETISCNQDANPAITVSDIPALVKLINGGE